MDLKYLQTFKVILETGSFRNAAEKLNCTQSTITFQIQQLGYDLSVQLFEKIGRRMVVTQAGKDLLPYVDTILQTYAQLKNYGKETQELDGTLVVAMPETLLTYKMQPVLSLFRQRAPKVELSLRALNCYAIRDQVLKGGADIGFHYDVGGYASTMIVEKLADFPISLIGHPNLDKRFCDFETSGQRNPSCLITNDRESIFQLMFDRYLREKNICLNGIMELGSIETIKRSVASGLGIAIMPSFVLEDDLTQNVLKEIPSGLSGKTITAVCSHHKNKWISPAMKLFIDLSKEHLRSPQS